MSSDAGTGTESGVVENVTADNWVDAVADVIEADGVVNQRVWADDAPPDATYPYVTITDAISVGPGLRGDGTTLMLVRRMQVDLWERLDREDIAVASRLFAALDSTTVTLANGSRSRLMVESAPRLPETSTNIAHRAVTIALRHDPSVM